MHCVHCGRPIFRAPAATVNTRGGALHFGPKCAAKNGLLPPPNPRRSLVARVSAALRPSRARTKPQLGQADWIDNLTTMPAQTGQEGQTP